MKKAARAIVVHNQSILLMKRNKFGHEYYILIGGAIEGGETAEAALAREAKEEASIEIANPRLVFVEDAGEPYGSQYIFTCDYAGGDVRISPSSEEAMITQLGHNTYQPEWVPLTKFATLPFRSAALQQQIIKAFQNGFPNEPLVFESRAEVSQHAV